MLQLAKFSVGSERLWKEKHEEDGDEDMPPIPNGITLNHSFAVRYRFKGDHDAEGKVSKHGAANATKEGKEVGTAWDFYCTAKKKFSFVGREVKQNKLGERNFYYVTYTKDDFDRCNNNEHEGCIVLANMECADDTKAIDGTSDIYMLRGFHADFKPKTDYAVRNEKN